jgi:methyl-accepting chemotaxis protein
VVADEVHKLAEESSREARNVGKSVQESRRALERAVTLLERIQGDLGTIVKASDEWLNDLQRITDTAAVTARAGKRVADIARASAELSGRITGSLEQAQVGAQESTKGVQAVAAASTEQLRAIEGLARGAAELAALADRLTTAVLFVRGSNGRR